MQPLAAVRSILRDSYYGLKAYFQSSYILPNAPNYLHVESYDGSNQVVHPDIYYNTRAWNGYRYWMVLTPFPHGNDKLENPSIYASNDGDNWTTPGNLSNPVTAAKRRGFHSDPDIVVSDKVMKMYYRYNPGDGSTLLNMKESRDGISWSTEDVLFSVPVSATFASPAVIVRDGEYYMYSVDTVAEVVTLRNSTDGVSWGPVKTLFHAPSIWHIDVLYTAGLYYMLYMKKPQGQLFFAESENGIDWRIYTTPVLGPSRHGWDNRWIYRSTFNLIDDRLVVWYSARSRKNEWHMAKTELGLDRFRQFLADSQD